MSRRSGQGNGFRSTEPFSEWRQKAFSKSFLRWVYPHLLEPFLDSTERHSKGIDASTKDNGSHRNFVEEAVFKLKILTHFLQLLLSESETQTSSGILRIAQHCSIEYHFLGEQWRLTEEQWKQANSLDCKSGATLKFKNSLHGIYKLNFNFVLLFPRESAYVNPCIYQNQFLIGYSER